MIRDTLSRVTCLMNGMNTACVITNRNLTILLKLNLNCVQPELTAEFKLISKILAGCDESKLHETV